MNCAYYDSIAFLKTAGAKYVCIEEREERENQDISIESITLSSYEF